MNSAFLPIIVLAVLAIIGIILYIYTKQISTSILLFIGAAILSMGIYLFGASSWRGISITMLLIGAGLLVVSVVFTIHKKNK